MSDPLPPIRYTQAGDVDIAYRVVGDGPIDLVWVPGLISNLEIEWEDHVKGGLYQRLAGFSRLITFDKRGMGLSDRSVGAPTLEERMDDVRAVMDAVGSERAALIGNSEGGFMTQLFAATYPERTEKAAAMGDRQWRELLDQHDRLVEREVAQAGGRLIKSTGDGVLATFDGPARGVTCGRRLHQAMATIGIDLRVGLHTGEIELRGDDIGGIGVHIGARVSGLADTGEVLVSRTITDLVAGSGLEFEDRGEHDLKGVPGSWQLYALRS